jgi:hypothetical protein
MNKKVILRSSFMLFLLLMMASPAFSNTTIANFVFPQTIDKTNQMLSRDLKTENLTTQYWRENNWQDSLFYEYYYNLQGNYSEVIHKQKTNGSWQETGRFIYQYDNSLNISLTWQEMTSSGWSNSYQYNYQYDNENLQECAYSEWVNNSWLEYSHGFYTYNANDELITEIWQYWLDEVTLVNWTKNEYEYHENGEISKNTQFIWNNNVWENYEQHLYTYTNENLITYIYQLWENNQWNNSYRYRYVYDGNNLVQQGFYDIWSESWLETSVASFVHDENDNVTLELWQTWIGNQLENYVRYLYQYTEVSNSEEDALAPELQHLTVYPNPFFANTNSKTGLTIRYESEELNSEVTCQIYNSKGQRIRQFKMKNEKYKMNEIVWDRKNQSGEMVASGVYFVTLQSGRKVLTNKFIIMK